MGARVGFHFGIRAVFSLRLLFLFFDGKVFWLIILGLGLCITIQRRVRFPLSKLAAIHTWLLPQAWDMFGEPLVLKESGYFLFVLHFDLKSFTLQQYLLNLFLSQFHKESQALKASLLESGNDWGNGKCNKPNSDDGDCDGD